MQIQIPVEVAHYKCKACPDLRVESTTSTYDYPAEHTYRCANLEKCQCIIQFLKEPEQMKIHFD